MLIKFLQIPIFTLFFFLLLGCKTTPNAKLDFSDGSYEGQINSDGEKHGVGIYRWIDGSIYEGDYSNDLRNGYGRFLWGNGESYEGDYLRDERTGKGVYRWPDGSFYEGEFLSGKRHGHGRYHSANGTIYEGEWFDDLQHGQGTLTYADGREINGIWRKGSPVSKPAVLPQTSKKPKLPKVILEQKAEIKSPSNTGLELDNANPDPKLLVSGASVSTQSSSLTQINYSNTEDLPTKDSPLNKLQIETADSPPASEDGYEELDPVDQSSTQEQDSVEPDWTGTVTEAESFFITELLDGIDTVRVRASGIPFNGRMRIVDSTGQAQGEVNLLNGRMHGEEIFYDDAGKVIERNFWSNGRPIGQ